MSAPGAARPWEAGFTLIEIMVVVSILALSMTVVPAITNGISGSRLRAASDMLVAELRELHTEAVRRNAPAEFTLSIRDRSYATTLEPGVEKLPDVVGRLEVIPAALADAKGIIRIRFEPDGSATAARIMFVNGGRSTVISVDWLTGRVSQGD